jgi:UDP-N-acetylmuramyl pentapeptide phosphotransferase/UDP-N-acetylglucosamine-1-phosphate transferase
MQHITILLLLSLFAFELFYFRLAKGFNIIDQPNHRSSHSTVTIRGGGIIFVLSAFLFFFVFDFQHPWFMLGLALIGTISFIDDIFTLNNKLRLTFHLIAVALLFFELNLFTIQWYYLIMTFIFVIATINAYNFMDGINGIMGSYSLLTVFTLYYINRTIGFASNELLIIIGLSLVVFNFFNFRRKAKCFAGDVGSVSMAFIIVFLIVQLMLKTHNFNYILLLLLYGIDTAITILFRVIRRENVFKAHRSHFYQFLANEKKWPHLAVSTLYFIIQLIINLLIVFVVKESMLFAFLLLIIPTVLLLATRFLLEGSKRLLSQQS